MVRLEAAWRRVLARAGLSLAMLAGGVSTTFAQSGDRFAPPPIIPASFCEQSEGYGCAAAAPCEMGVPCDACAPCNSCGACQSCAPCESCGECETCESCEPCCAGPRCMDPFYVALSGGWQMRETVHEIGDPSTFIVFDDGFAANIALGYRLNLCRIEAEYSYMNNPVKDAASSGYVSVATGSINLRCFMVNVYRDFELPITQLRPYVGAGIGTYQSEINSMYPAFFAEPALRPDGFATNPVNTTSNMPLAYQFRAGLSRPIGERTELYAGYRYFRGEVLTFACPPFASPSAPTFSPNGADIHSAEVGLRVRF